MGEYWVGGGRVIRCALRKLCLDTLFAHTHAFVSHSIFLWHWPNPTYDDDDCWYCQTRGRATTPSWRCCRWSTTAAWTSSWRPVDRYWVHVLAARLFVGKFAQQFLRVFFFFYCWSWLDSPISRVKNQWCLFCCCFVLWAVSVFTCIALNFYS